MSNICHYEIRVYGRAQSVWMVYASMPCLEEKQITFQAKSEKAAWLRFTGVCPWSVNHGVTDTWQGDAAAVRGMTREAILAAGSSHQLSSLRAKSEALSCEIRVHYWSAESGYDQFDHYKNGRLLKQRRIPHGGEIPNPFDWDAGEFPGHEGVYCEDTEGESQDAHFPEKLQGTDASAPAAEPAAPAAPPEAPADLYSWRFEEGRRIAGEGWSVGIPDGFVMDEGRRGDRDFALVPAGYAGEAPDDIPLQLLSSQGGGALLPEDQWPHHPAARACIAQIQGRIQARTTGQFLGTVPDVLSHGWGDLAAYTLVIATGADAFSYQTNVLTGSRHQGLQIQTRRMTFRQREALEQSLCRWLETFRFREGNPFLSPAARVEDPACLQELLSGRTSLYEAAGAQASGSMQIASNLLPILKQNGLFHGDRPRLLRATQERLKAITEYYTEKFDTVLQKIWEGDYDAAFWEKIFSHAPMVNAPNGIIVWELEGKKYTIHLSKACMAAQTRWQKKRDAVKAGEEPAGDYESALAAWEAETAAAEERRREMVAQGLAQKQVAGAKALEAALKARLRELYGALKEEMACQAAAEEALSQLGAFQFRQKSRQKKILEETGARIPALQAQIADAKADYRQKLAALPQLVRRQEDQLRREAEQQFPLPQKPLRPGAG